MNPPSYLQLLNSGELTRRAASLSRAMGSASPREKRQMAAIPTSMAAKRTPTTFSAVSMSIRSSAWRERPRRTAPIVTIELGPTITGTDPGNGAGNAPHDPTIEVDFSEPVTVDPGWLTAAAGFWVAGREKDLKNGLALAARTLDSGKPEDLIGKLKELK